MADPSKDINMIDDEDDEVVCEMDVFLNGNVNNGNFYLFQYPLRPSQRSYDNNASLNQVMMKVDDESNLKMKYEFEVMETKFLNSIKEDKTKTYTQTLSSQKIDPSTNYCIGVVRNKNLQLIPISYFLQFRPDFSNLDEGNKKRSKSDKPKDKKFDNMKKELIIDDKLIDEWVNLKCYKYTQNNLECQIVFNKLVEESKMKVSKPETISKKDYFDIIFNNINKENQEELVNQKKVKNPSSTLTFKDLQDLPVENKIEYLMKKCNITSFTNLKNLIIKSDKKLEKLYTDKTLIEILSRYADMLKNGNFIYKSELRYNGRPQLINARDTIINILQNNPDGIKKAEINSLVKIEKEELSEILSEIGMSLLTNWYLKEQKLDNSKFIEENKKIYEEKIKIWDLRANNGSTKVEKGLKSNIISNVINKQVNNTTSTTNTTTSITKTNNNTSNTSNSTTNNTELEAKIKKMFEKNEFLALSSLLPSLNDLKNNNISLEENTNLINSVIDNLCYKFNDILFIKTIGDETLDKIRQSIFEQFKQKSNIKKSDILTNLNNLDIKHDDKDLTKVLKSIAIYQNKGWNLKGLNQED